MLTALRIGVQGNDIPIWELAAVALGGICFCAWRYSQAKQALIRWASANQIKIEKYEYRVFACGPYSSSNRRFQPVFRIHVSDTKGHPSRGWVLCGVTPWGTLESAAYPTEVFWDYPTEPVDAEAEVVN